MRRAIVLGIEGLSPALVKRWVADLPVLLKMRTGGVWGNLVSTVPPSTPQAWISAFSGRNPGAYGVWGRKLRANHAYTLDGNVDSRVLEERIRPLYSTLSRLGQRVGMVNVPGTIPVPKVPGGYCIVTVGTSDGAGLQTWPDGIVGEVGDKGGEFIAEPQSDGTTREGLDTKAVLEKIRKMDEQRFHLVEYLVRDKKCDIVLATVDGAGLVSRVFLQDAEPSHPHYRADSPDRHVLPEYYRWIDGRIGDIFGRMDEDTVLCVFSVSSVQPLKGIFYLNEWLLENGYLHLKKKPSGPTPFENLDVDWGKTACWAMGGDGQIYVNLTGREKNGNLPQTEYYPFLEKLSREIAGNRKAECFLRNDVCFGSFSDLGPDLFVHIDGGCWKIDDRVGFGKTEETGTARELIAEGSGRLGYISFAGSDFPAAGELPDVSVLDIAPTIIDIMNLREPYSAMKYELEGYSLLKLTEDVEPPKEDEEKEKEREDKVRSRLEALGY